MMTNSLHNSASAMKKYVASYDVFLAAVAALLTVLELRLLWRALHLANIDTNLYYLPWLQHIVTYGPWASLEASYANYSPPYLYILSAFSLLHHRLSPIVIVKLAQLPGMVAAAWLFWSICRRLGCSQLRSLLAAWTVLVAPEVFQYAIVWGQCDMIHTACLLGMLRLLLARRPAWAMLLLGVALAFKLQAIFAGAAVGALFLAGELPLWTALFVPLGYLLMLTPAYLAGRPWPELLLVYNQQYGTWPAIAMHVANPYQLIHHLSMHYRGVYPAAFYGGLLLATAATVWLVLFLVRSPWRLRGQQLVLALAAALLLEPYVLPKMHDRYFFAGDTFLLLLAMMRPQLWLPAAMLQASAILVAYHFLYAYMPVIPTAYYILPVLLTTAALIWVGRVLLTSSPPR